MTIVKLVNCIGILETFSYFKSQYYKHLRFNQLKLYLILNEAEPFIKNIRYPAGYISAIRHIRYLAG